MKKVALYGKFSPAAIEMFREGFPREFEIVTFERADELEKLREVQFMINRSYDINETVIRVAPQLRLIQKWGAGYDKIDVKAAGARGIPVAICLGVNSAPVAELAILHILAVYRNLLPLNQKLKQGNWARDEYAKKSYMVQGKNLGLLGLGSIGQRVGSIAKRGFGASVQYYDLRRMQEEKEMALGFRYVDLDTLLATSDIISLHVPLLESTQNLINAAAFDKMKPSAILINTSRGGVIDEQALIQALRDKKIAGAGLDTFSSEPLSADSPLAQFENVVLTPHCGGNTADNDVNMVQCCIDNILKIDNDHPLLPPVLVNQAELVGALPNRKG